MKPPLYVSVSCDLKTVASLCVALFCAVVPALAQEGEPLDPFGWMGDRGGGVAPSGNKESARIVSRGGDCIVVETDQWLTSDKETGGRRGANTLVGVAGETYAVVLRNCLIEKGMLDDGRWSWGPLRGEPARLQIVVPAIPDSERAGLSREKLLLADRLVVNLPFSHTIGGSTKWTLAGHEWAGVFHVPAGQELEEARGNPTNQLARLDFLKEVTCDYPCAFRLLTGADGYWELQTDFGDDGVPDIVWTARDKGRRPHRMAKLPARSFQLIRVESAGLGGEDGVARSRATLAIRPPGNSAPVKPFGKLMNTRPLTLRGSTNLYASPAVISGLKWDASWQVTVEDTLAKTNISCHVYGNRDFTIRLALDPDRRRPIVVTQSQQATQALCSSRSSLALGWLPVPLEPAGVSTSPPLALVQGQSVRLQYPAAATFMVTLTNRAPQRIEAGSAPALYCFQEPGAYAILALDAQAHELASRRFRVTGVGLPSRLLQQGQNTTHLVFLGDYRIDDVAFRVCDTNGNAIGPAVKVVEQGGPFARVSTSLTNGHYRFRVECKGTGVVLGETALTAFDLALTGGDVDFAPLGAMDAAESPCTFCVRMTPYVPDVTIEFVTLARFCRFRNDALSFTVNSSGGLSSNGESPMVIPDSEAYGIFPYYIILPRYSGEYAHRFDALIAPWWPADFLPP